MTDDRATEITENTEEQPPSATSVSSVAPFEASRS